MYRRIFIALILAICCTGAASAETQSSASFELQHMESRDAMTVLRSMLGLKGIETVGEQKLNVTASKEDLKAVRGILDLVDVSADQKPAMETLEVAREEGVIGRFMLQYPIAREVMGAVRQQVQPKHIAAVQDPGLIILRGSSETIAAAKKVIDSMQKAKSQGTGD
ncbi:MAG: hypothetical protein AAF725_18875 [Acidobacteriota bacterium]